MLQNAPKNVGGSGLVAMVTGGSGFLGQHVVRVLQEKGEHLREIRVFDIVPYMRKMGVCFMFILFQLK